MKRTLAETKIFQKLVFDFDQVWNYFFSLKILDSPSATWCENNWQGAQKGPRQFPLISCHADDMLDFSTLANFRHQEIFCASARLIVSMKHTIYTGCFFNCSSPFSVRKWKTLLSQRGAFWHWKFLEKIVIIGRNFFILVLKIRRDS